MQNKVKKLVEEYNLSCGTAARYMDLVSEIGELGKEILKKTEYGQKDYAINETSIEEMGDCIFSLLALCSEMEIDAVEALDHALEKYRNRCCDRSNPEQRKEPDKMGLTETSKFLSLILRHKPEVIGISLDEHGWAEVDELIAGINRTRKFDKEMLEEIVRTDSKQRYSFNEDKTLIRANQGHSIPVDVQLDAVKPPETLWHGTGEKYVSSIDQIGLISKSRLYVHISGDIETAYKVGQRHGKPVIYKVLAGKMSEDGYTFYRSKNGVWLIKEVPVRYLEKQRM